MTDFLASPLLGGIASGLFGLGGGLLSSAGQSAANAQNAMIAQQQLAAQQQQFNDQMGFNWQQFDTSTNIALQNLALQSDAFMYPVSTRVADARANGISPLVALGMQPSTPAPVSVGAIGTPGGTISGGGGNAVNTMGGIGQAVGNFGQDISRAINATKTPEERAAVALQQTSMIKDNDVKDAHIEALHAAANADNARASYYSKPIPNVVGSSPHPDVEIKPKQGYADEAYKTTAGTMEYQAAPGTTASQSFLEGTLATARNRLGGLMPGDKGAPRPDRVMADMQRLFPGSVGFKQIGLGNYIPVYPEDQVKEDVRAEVQQNRLKNFFDTSMFK